MHLQSDRTGFFHCRHTIDVSSPIPRQVRHYYYHLLRKPGVRVNGPAAKCDLLRTHEAMQEWWVRNEVSTSVGVHILTPCLSWMGCLHHCSVCVDGHRQHRGARH